MPRADWQARRLSRHFVRARALYSTLLYFTLLTGFPSQTRGAERSSSLSPSPPAPPAQLEDAAELVRDAPLYPPLRDPRDPTDTGDEPETSIEHSDAPVTPGGEGEDEEEGEERTKRSSNQQWDKGAKPAPASAAASGTGARRVQTGDTILNIRGAVRDAIGDAGAAPGPRASSRIDTFVIRPAGAHRAPPAPPASLASDASSPRAQPSTGQGGDAKSGRSLLVSAQSRARIECELGDTVPAASLRWYKDDELVVVPAGGPDGGARGEAMWSDGAALVIARVARADAATWRCAGRERAGAPTHLMIYERVRSVYLAVDGRRLDAGNTWVPVRDKTVLEVRCVAEGGVPAPELSWRLLAPEPALDHRPYLRIHHTNYSIEGVASSHAVVTAARELHNATLQCEARQPQPAPGGATPVPAHSPAEPLAARLEIHVTYPPSFVISRWPGFGVALTAGGAAALRCDVDANPPARAWWLRDDAHTSSSPPPLEAGAEARGSATLRWAALQAAHAGWYRCRASWLDAEYSSIGYYLNVLAPEQRPEEPAEGRAEVEEPELQQAEVALGGSVQLQCPQGSVGCWWRRVLGNASEPWAPAGSHHAHGVLGIRDALYQEGGEYRCVGARAPDLQRVRELKRVTLRVTGGATATALSARPAATGWRLECGACGRGVRVNWQRRAAAAAPPPPERAALQPDLAQHCWRAVLHVAEPDEVWCVAAAGGGGAVAVFPARAPSPSPAPARHSVRAQLAARAAPPARPRRAALLLLGLLLAGRRARE